MLDRTAGEALQAKLDVIAAAVTELRTELVTLLPPAAVNGTGGKRCRRPGGRIDRHDQRGGEDRVCARHNRDVVQDGAGRRRLEGAGRYASRHCGGTSKGKSQPVECSSTPR
jgi:hypothetical protein